VIADWNDAYSNSPYIPDASAYPGLWAERAEKFRAVMRAAGNAEIDLVYGAAPRHRLDLFHTEGRPKGLAMFIHGGYWMTYDKSSWSHLAAGALKRGWSVAMPSYTLAPEARIGDIVGEIASAVTFAAARVEGPIALAGHSAGGHLVSRLACAEAPLSDEVARRIGPVVSISGLHDLRPLMNTRLNDTLRLDEAEACNHSPALLRPREGARVTCWVGALERPEFLRQNDLLANIWTALGAQTRSVHAPGRHHFDVIAELEDAESALTAAFAPASLGGR
jgi:acetyl esterase/lipase